MLWKPSIWSSSDILNWQSYTLDFCLHMTIFFKVDVWTKIHRLMRYIDLHLTHLGCILGRSSEENWMTHKEFKILYNVKNKHLDAICMKS